MHKFQVECFHTLAQGNQQLLASYSTAVEAIWRIINKQKSLTQTGCFEKIIRISSKVKLITWLETVKLLD